MERKEYISPEAGAVVIRYGVSFCASSFTTEGKDVPDYEEDDLKW